MKHLTGFLAPFLFAVLPVSAADLSDLTYTTTGGEVTITDCDTSASGTLVIPDTIEGNPVTSIGDSAFRDCTSLTSITIGNSVTSIGGYAFRDCTSLTSVTIPESVTSIGEAAFSGCTALTTIEVGVGNGNYTEVNGVLFDREMTLLHTYPAGKTDATYVIPDSVTSIGAYAFDGCTSLTSITIPDSVTSIGDYAFRDCTSLTSITIGNSVTSIGDYAFRDCTSLTSITFGENSQLASIGTWAFRDCSSLTSITIPDSVTSIGRVAFDGCTSLTSITIPDSVTSIGAYAFRDCTSLTSITIPDSVTSIQERTFYSCTSLTSITIPDGVTSIGDGAFSSCSSLTSITIPDSVTSIGAYAFDGCTSLTSITIPDSVTSIGAYAFVACTSLTNITFMGTAPTVGVSAFSGVSEEAQALVSGEFADSFGGFGSTWEGLLVSSSVGSTIGAAIVAGSGSVEGVGTFTNGTSVTLTATPAAGQVFIAWTGDASGSENPLTLTVEGDINIGAIFIEPAAYALVTQESFDEVVAERDARYTEDQIRALSADYTIGLNDAGNVQMKFNLFESADLSTFAPLTLNPDSVSVVDGSICIEFAPEDRAAFFRFNVE